MVGIKKFMTNGCTLVVKNDPRNFILYFIKFFLTYFYCPLHSSNNPIYNFRIQAVKQVRKFIHFANDNAFSPSH